MLRRNRLSVASVVKPAFVMSDVMRTSASHASGMSLFVSSVMSAQLCASLLQSEHCGRASYIRSRANTVLNVSDEMNSVSHVVLFGVNLTMEFPFGVVGCASHS